MKLLAAIDETDDGEYLAFVVASPSKIQSNANVLPSGFTHMTSMNTDKDGKMAVLNSFDFEGDILVYCVQFGLPTVKTTVAAAVSSGKCRMARHTVTSKIAYEFVYKVRFLYADFTNRYRTTVDDLVFEVDNATVRRYLVDGGLKACQPGIAHKIADCVAYANGHQWPVHDAIKELGSNFKKDFHGRVIKTLTR